MEEIKEFKDKEAKIAAIGKGNELIKREVLIKIQQAKTQIENECVDVDKSKETEEINKNETQKKAEKRKRKMSTEKIEPKEIVAPITEKKVHNNKNTKNSKSEINKNVKPYQYKNVNYRKFYDDTDKAHKQPKTKFKKHK